MAKISIILPVFNEEAGIKNFHQELLNSLNTVTNHEFEIIYVVDKSRDNSIDILREIAEKSNNVIVLGLSRRFGHQMSLVAGIDFCSGDACIMMDCDLEHPPSFIPLLIQKYEDGFDVVHTKRFYAQEIGYFKKFFSKKFYKILNILSSENLGQDSADFRLISKSVINEFKKNIREHNQYLRGLFHWIGFKQTEISFQAGARGAGQSNYRLMNLIKLATDGLVSFTKVPLQMGTYLGLLISIIGLAYAAYSSFAYFFREGLPPGWTTIITLILIIGGLTLIMLGVTGLYVAAIFDEVKNRPLYVVQTQYGLKNKDKSGEPHA
jgi:dolichol-phosphate mannosyltransferase